MNARSLRRWAALGLSAALLAPQAYAMPREDRARLRTAYEAAVAGRCGEALRIWGNLRDVVGDRTLVTGNMGHCLEALGRDEEALAAFRRAKGYAAVDEAPANDPRQSRIARLDARIAGLETRLAGQKVGRGTVRVTCDRDDVRVQIDDRPTTLCPATFELDAGPHTLQGAAGGETWSEQIEVEVGETLDVEIAFDSTWPWIVGGAAVAAVAITVVALVATTEDPQPRIRVLLDE